MMKQGFVPLVVLLAIGGVIVLGGGAWIYERQLQSLPEVARDPAPREQAAQVAQPSPPPRTEESRFTAAPTSSPSSTQKAVPGKIVKPTSTAAIGALIKNVNASTSPIGTSTATGTPLQASSSGSSGNSTPFSQGGGGNGWEPSGPPPLDYEEGPPREAVDACRTKTVGTECSFHDPIAGYLPGICEMVPTGELACVPPG